MPWAASDLDFAVVDRARTLGDLLRLLFAMQEAFGPKDVADMLTEFDSTIVVDPETAGRWLRNERRPSKQHLQLIVRLLQSRRLMGSPPARDRVFIRIAAFYAGLEEPRINAIRPIPPIATQLPVRRPSPGAIGIRLRELRQHYKLAVALQSDLQTPEEEMSFFEARRTKFGLDPLINQSQELDSLRLIHSRAMAAVLAQQAAALAQQAIQPPPTWWQRFVQSLLSLVGAR